MYISYQMSKIILIFKCISLNISTFVIVEKNGFWNKGVREKNWKRNWKSYLTTAASVEETELVADDKLFHEFITCFSRILNLRIYEYFSKKCYVSFLRWLQSVFFCYVKQVYRHFWFLHEHFCTFIDSGIVKTCDELDLSLVPPLLLEVLLPPGKKISN